MILYSAPSSYFSMIARFALNESQTPFDIRKMDIHLAKEQLSSWYMAINPAMTVPALTNNATKWTDSRDILNYSAQQAGEKWYDAEPALLPHIQQIVTAHYQISIEQLTFGKAMTKFSLLHKIFPRMLERMIKQLENEEPKSKNPIAIQNKIKLDQERFDYFQGDLEKKLNDRREDVRRYIQLLPTTDALLFGDKISSADIVTAILFARLHMIGEESLINESPALVTYFEKIKNRPAFLQSDIWLKFKPWRILLKY